MTVGALLVVGELCADIVVELAHPPTFGQHEQLVPSTTITMGSSSAITACGAAALGVPTSMVGVVGDDLLGRHVRQLLDRRDVDSSSVRVDPATPTGSSTILSLPDGDRSILTALGSIGHTRVADVPPKVLADASHVHVGSYFLQYALQPDLSVFFAECRERGITTSLDPNFDPAGAWDAGIEAVLGHTDVFLCNAAEALSISHIPSLPAAVGWFAGRMPAGSTLVVKEGADGASAHRLAGTAVTSVHQAVPPRDDRPLVDTVGAGDSLTAGYLSGRLRGWTDRDALELGVRNGTASTRAAGGVDGQLTAQDIETD